MNCARNVPLALVLFALIVPARASWISPFISEIHYDNAGMDVGEFVAVTATAGTDLSGWQVVFYNGADGGMYDSESLSTVPAGGSWGEVFASYAGIQNGPDAVALVSADAAVIEFIAYEGAVTAMDGPASGLAARQLPLAEAGSTAAGWSLQRTGGADEWRWVAAVATPGVVNPGLELAAAARVPTVGVATLLLSGIGGWWLLVGRRWPREKGVPAVA